MIVTLTTMLYSSVFICILYLSIIPKLKPGKIFIHHITFEHRW
jgi:hypothetical protein